VRLPEVDATTARRLKGEHDLVLGVVEQIRTVADDLTGPGLDLAPVRGLHARLVGELLPHERAEERELVPVVARALGGSAATAGLSRTHAEIEHQVSRLGRLLDDAEGGPGSAEDVTELRRLLYGLYGILRLHNAQEEEGAFSMLPTAPGPPAPGARR
jgi:hypothetical protein